jgi:S1-C subfamily serine protease
VQFPQVIVAEKRGQYVVAVAIVRDRIAAREAEALLKDNHLTTAVTDSGGQYSQILYGVNPFSPDIAYSLGFPRLAPPDPNAPYLQLASRIALPQALEIAMSLRAKGIETGVVLIRNGWFAVVVMPSARNARLLVTLKQEKRIPGDSIAVAGTTYVEAIWAPSLFTPDERLIAQFPELKFSDARAALAAGDGASALKILQSDWRRTGATDYALAADILLRGLGGVRQNSELAAQWLNACAPNSVRCTLMLAEMTEAGRGVPKDARKAASLYRTAAASGDARAQVRLATMLILGEGAVQDFEEGLKLLQTAASAGNPDAQSLLGTSYKTGFLTDKNLSMSYFWLSLAGASMDAGAERDKLVKDRNEIAVKLGSERLLDIQKVARTWKPGDPVPSFDGADRGQLTASNDGEKPQAAQKREQSASSGSGFFIDATGRFVTNAHVVAGCSSITATNANGMVAPATLISADTTNDLALLQTTVAVPSVARIRTGAKLGETVAVFGFPLTGFLATGGNFTTGNIVALAGLGDDSRHFQISAPVQPGNSGGPLIDSSANVIGVVVSKVNALRVAVVTNDIPQNINFAIKSATLASFLDAKQASYEASPATAAMASEALADRARNFSVLVVCR